MPFLSDFQRVVVVHYTLFARVLAFVSGLQHVPNRLCVVVAHYTPLVVEI